MNLNYKNRDDKMEKIISIKDALKLENKIFIDVRSESEYQKDHIVNAINIPILDDDERKEVGTLYKRLSKKEAIKLGINCVSKKLDNIYEKISNIKEEYENIILYCHRGGMRSNSLKDFLNSMGIDCLKLDLGYKGYRKFLRDYFETLDKKFIVLHGNTGVGKTKILENLKLKNVDVLDLEGIAKNSGSVFGYISFGLEPPTQSYFESKLFKCLYDSNKIIFVESESKRIGRSIIPDNIFDKISKGKHYLIESSLSFRVETLYEMYIKSSFKDEENIINSLKKLKKRIGNEKLEFLINLVKNNNYKEVIKILINQYYDPLYKYSIDKYEYIDILNSDDIDKIVNLLVNIYDELKRRN